MELTKALVVDEAYHWVGPNVHSGFGGEIAMWVEPMMLSGLGVVIATWVEPNMISGFGGVIATITPPNPEVILDSTHSYNCYIWWSLIYLQQLSKPCSLNILLDVI